MVYSNDSQKDEAGSSNDASLDEKLLNTVLNDPVCPEDEANLEKAINKTAENLKDFDTPLLSEPELSTPILKRKRKVGPVRQKWTDFETTELEHLFRNFIKGKICPSKKDIEKRIRKSKKRNGYIWKRQWEKIKKKVWNM
ncbi:unnamed protein product, partial [Owenia fusiformis]